MTEQERIERAYRLAFPCMECDPARIKLTLVTADEAFDRAGRACPASNRLNWAILALALLPEGGGTLGRWEFKRHSYGLIFTRPDDGGTHGKAYRSRRQRTWVVELDYGAYLDGTAAELLLLMAAADELARREAAL